MTFNKTIMCPICTGSCPAHVDFSKCENRFFNCTICNKHTYDEDGYDINELPYCENCAKHISEDTTLEDYTLRYTEYMQSFSLVEKYAPEYLKNCHLKSIGEQIAKDKLVSYKYKSKLREEYKRLLKIFQKAAS